MLEQFFTYSPLGKAFKKQTKAIENQGKKQVEALTALKPTEQQSKPKSIEGIIRKKLQKMMTLKKN